VKLSVRRKREHKTKGPKTSIQKEKRGEKISKAERRRNPAFGNAGNTERKRFIHKEWRWVKKEAAGNTAGREKKTGQSFEEMKVALHRQVERGSE